MRWLFIFNQTLFSQGREMVLYSISTHLLILCKWFHLRRWNVYFCSLNCITISVYLLNVYYYESWIYRHVYVFRYIIITALYKMLHGQICNHLPMQAQITLHFLPNTYKQAEKLLNWEAVKIRCQTMHHFTHKKFHQSINGPVCLLDAFFITCHLQQKTSSSNLMTCPYFSNWLFSQCNNQSGELVIRVFFFLRAQSGYCHSVVVFVSLSLLL